MEVGDTEGRSLWGDGPPAKPASRLSVPYRGPTARPSGAQATYEHRSGVRQTAIVTRQDHTGQPDSWRSYAGPVLGCATSAVLKRSKVHASNCAAY
jgi:hypothetical protein